MLDAPVSGGPAGAASGQLTIWVGGEREVFDRHVELLRIFASAPRYVGTIGAGTVAKLTHNMVGYMIILSLAEGFSMGVKAGLDPLDL
jgi:3-hydroxyisobutyrate dehydrogenase